MPRCNSIISGKSQNTTATSQIDCIQRCQHAILVTTVNTRVDCPGVLFDDSLNVNNCLLFIGNVQEILELDILVQHSGNGS